MDQKKIGAFIAQCRKEKSYQQSYRGNRISAFFPGTDAAYEKNETGRCDFA